MLSEDQQRDLLMLAAFYDQSTGEPIERRWNRLRKLSRFRSTVGRTDLQIGVVVSVVAAILLVLGLVYGWPAGIGGAALRDPDLAGHRRRWAGPTGAGGTCARPATPATSAAACAS